MSEQSFINGFIKRAGEYGVDQRTASQLIKQAVGMFAPAPPKGIEQMGAGMQQASRMPLSSPISPAMHQYATKPMEPAGMPQYSQQAAPTPPAPIVPPAPTPQPFAPSQADLMRFRKTTNSKFNANSAGDMESMRRLLANPHMGLRGSSQLTLNSAQAHAGAGHLAGAAGGDAQPGQLLAGI